MECQHERVKWISGQEGVVVTLNGPVAAVCLDCGMEATMEEDGR